ncbi:peptidase M16 [Tenacibaculum holothuriorum]|uniref:Peptidase M16 n=2 Tax=Tenacibaculum holothuriorum TaxID=1635173 RepID=A0A1Y2PBC6_9FLAO|nr:peptidase M16 [Tenacibaculum holothuriorum]
MTKQKMQTAARKGKIAAMKIPTDPSVKIGKLSNGLTYYIKKNAKPANKVELRLAVNAGSILEDDDQLGLAHFMEHMNFNGTKNFKKNELVDYLQSIGVKFGAHLNAYTGFDETVYILPIPSDDEAKLEKGFQILEDWAHGALLEGKDIDEERGVVLEEYRSRRDAGSRMLQKYLPKVMHGSKYAERLPIGTKENLENFKHESIRRFHKDWYRPDLMAVIAVGDVDVAKLEEKIKAHFAHIPAVKNPRKRVVAPLKNHKETFIAIEADKEAPFSRVQVMYKDHDAAKPVVTLGDYRNSMVKSLFTQMLNNRLDELRNAEKPPFVYGFSYHGGTWARGKNAYQSIAGTSADGQLSGLQALLDENERVKRYGFTPGELERAKKNVIARLEKSFKNKDKTESNRIIGEYVNNYLEQEPIPGIEWEYKVNQRLLPTIKLDDVNKIIKNYLHDDNRVVVITGPKKVVTEQQVIDALNSAKTKDLKPYEDVEVASSLITKAPTPGSIIKVTENKDLGTKTFVLSNGAKVTYKKTDFKNDEILFEAFSFGGTSLYTDEEAKATSFANGALSQAGVNNFKLNDLSKMMMGKIVRVNPFIGTYSEGFRGNASPKDLETLFEMVHLYFTALNKDESAFKSFVNKQKGFLGNLLASPNFFFQKEMSEFVYGKNPRYTGFPTPEKYDKADYNLAYKKYQERFADAGDFNFYFVGNVDEKKLAEYATKYIASLPGKNSNEKYKVSSFRPLSGSHTKIVAKGKDPKSQVRINYRGEAEYNKKDALAFESLIEAVKIKLTEQLREKEGGVYSAGAYGSLSKMPYGSYSLTISFPCAPENVEKLKNIAVQEVENMVKNGPTSEDLDKTKKAMILEHKEDVKKNRFWLRTIKNIDYLQNDGKDLSSYENKVNALTKEEIQKVAKKYLTNGYILGVLNPEK